MNDLFEMLLRGEPRALAAALVFASLLVHAFGSNLSWRYLCAAGARPPNRLLGGALSKTARSFYEVLRLIYYVGLPGAAVVFGWVDIRAMGLGYLDWPDGLRWTIVIALATWSLITFIWVPYLRATKNLVRAETDSSFSRRAVEVIYQQAHWAFYRAAAILMLSNFLKDDMAIYWGTAAGLALIAVEALADPHVGQQISRPGAGEVALWNGTQAIVNAVGFVLTRNVWLLTLIHLALEFSVPHVRTIGQAVPPPVPITQMKVVTNR